MKKRRITVFLLTAILLLAPTVILIVRGASVGRFPKPNEALGIEIINEQGKTTSLDPEDLLFDAFFEIVSDSERIASSELPKGCESFDVRISLSDQTTERLRLYFHRSDCSLYIRNSEMRLFLFRDPELELLDTVLSPSKIELCAHGEETPFFSYPSRAEDLPIPDIELSRWEKLGEITSTEDAAQITFNLYQRGSDGGYVPMGEITDFSSLAGEAPDSVVLCVVRWALFDRIDLLHYYFFSIGAK